MNTLIQELAEQLQPPEVVSPAPTLDWEEDKGKKNTLTRVCGKCTKAFFGKKSRKYCVPCQKTLSQTLHARGYTYAEVLDTNMSRKDRRHNY